ncbi:MAG: hypothetical protein JNL50_13365 [Phycisphaerae bacterium]|nr:hypothetical protein [Phycisphaerae bacterium]
MHEAVNSLPGPCRRPVLGSVQSSRPRPSSSTLGAWLPSAARLFAAAGLSLSLAACAAPRSGASTSQPPATDSRDVDHAPNAPEAPPSLADAPGISDDARAARRQLEALAQSPAPPQPDIPLPPGLDAAEFAPSPDSPESRRTLDDILASAPAPVPIEPAPTQPSDESRLEALRLYSQGRAKLLAGDAEGAVLDLEGATKLDPASPEPFRALGEARVAAGRRLSATDAFRRAVALGLRDPRVYWQLGQDADRAGNTDEAINLFISSLNSRPEKADPAMPFVVWMDLADALVRRGSHRAAVDAIAKAVDLPPQFGTSTRLRAELGELLRRRAELTRQAGDLLCRLGEFDRAVRAYEASALHGSPDPVSLWKRKTYALLRAGRGAEAASLAVAIAANAKGVLEPSDLALLRYIADASGHAPLVGRALAPASSAPTAISNIARARAAIAPPADAADILSRHLVLRPSDAPAARDLTAAALRSPDAVTILARAVGQSPLSAGTLAHALRARVPSFDPWLATLATLAADRTPGAALLRARILILIERPAEALDALTNEPNATPTADHATALARIEAAMARGRFDLVESSLAFLSDAPAAIRARAFDLCGRRAEAAELIELAAAESESPQTRLDAAALAMSRGDAKAAEAHLRRAFDLDPGEPRVYEGLISLYAPGAALANQEKLTEVARALRTASPGSSLLRFLAAQELTGGGALNEAARLLKQIADEHPENDAVGLLLGSVWDRARADPKSLAENESWLRALIDRSPEEPWPALVLARLLVLREKAQDAADFLTSRWNARPLRDYSIARERLLREVLKNPAEADAVEKDRLARDAGTLSGAIESAISSLRRADWSGAADALSAPWPAWLTLNANASAALASATIGALSDAPPQQVGRPDVSRVIEAAARLCPSLPPQLHERRVQIIATTEPVDLAAVRAAVERAAKDFPSGAHVFNARAAIGVAASAPRDSLPFLRAAADYPAVADDLLFELLRMTVVHGQAPDIDALLAQFNTSASITKLAATAIKDPKIPEAAPKAQAELAYLLGNLCTSQGREEMSRYCYRAALSFDPDHAWSMNNLGYAILERGGDFAESEKLLARAAQLLPDEASVVDSLAWLRYHENIIADEVAPDGRVTRAGAVTLLRRAVSLEGGKENPTLHDHLGDALWRAGNKDQARDVWKKALEFSRVDIRELSQNASAAARERLQKEFDSILAKLQAADAGQEPAVAPPIKPANQ